jgi:hypothetical protein
MASESLVPLTTLRPEVRGAHRCGWVLRQQGQAVRCFNRIGHEGGHRFLARHAVPYRIPPSILWFTRQGPRVSKGTQGPVVADRAHDLP